MKRQGYINQYADSLEFALSHLPAHVADARRNGMSARILVQTLVTMVGDAAKLAAHHEGKWVDESEANDGE